jgi:hypothetical protein
MRNHVVNLFDAILHQTYDIIGSGSHSIDQLPQFILDIMNNEW